jgi:hypothetical protein
VIFATNGEGNRGAFLFYPPLSVGDAQSHQSACVRDAGEGQGHADNHVTPTDRHADQHAIPMSSVAWRSQVLKCQTLALVKSTRRNTITIAGHRPISYTLWRQFDQGIAEEKPQTLGEFLPAWLEAIKPSIGARTYNVYEVDIRIHLVEKGQNTQISASILAFFGKDTLTTS